MDNRRKNIVYSLILITVVSVLWFYRRNQIHEQDHHLPKNSQQSQAISDSISLYTLKGRAQGTTYTIKYVADTARLTQQAVDSLLRAFDQALSTYEPASEVSRFNASNDSVVVVKSPWFIDVIKISQKVFQDSEGHFDPTIGPLLRVWNFSEIENPEFSLPNADTIAAAQSKIGLNKLTLQGDTILRPPYLQLNFNAIAQGYSIDILAQMLDKQGVNRYFIELGGEISAKGTNQNQQPWRAGVVKPVQGTLKNPLAATVTLKNQALATSGNYRHFYEVEGQIYGHTINPILGQPVRHNLRSVSVVANTAALADAWATAMVSAGTEQAKIWAAEHNLKVLLFYYNPQNELKSWTSEPLKDQVNVLLKQPGSH